jgi:hypothetical protein
MQLEIRNKTEYLEYIETQPEKTAVFFGDYNDFNKDELWDVYEQFRSHDKVIVPIASPKDNTFFNHFFELITIFDNNYHMEIELYLSSDFAESIGHENSLLVRFASSIKIVHNPVIIHIPFEKRRKPFYDLVKSLLADSVDIIEI